MFLLVFVRKMLNVYLWHNSFYDAHSGVLYKTFSYFMGKLPETSFGGKVMTLQVEQESVVFTLVSLRNRTAISR